jgi:hypothetical protein
MHPAPGFARLSRDGLHLLLNAPGAGGAGAGRRRTPTRRVESLPAHGG